MLVISCAFVVVTMVLRSNVQDDFRSLLLFLIIMHAIDIVSYLLEMIGFILKNFKFLTLKGMLYIPSFGLALTV
jgi:hypothetical protein